MKPTPTVDAFWKRYTNSQEIDNRPCPDAFYFCDNRQDANVCAELVVAGIKQATAPSLWWFRTRGEDLPRVEEYFVVTNCDGKPQAEIQTTVVEVVPFGLVDAAFAHAEGEDDRSLTEWRRVHRSYYAREMGGDESKINDGFEVVCHRFRCVFYD
jgi:uncharacterized protein YhfF